MLIGHYAAGLAASTATRRIPLWVFFLAVQAIDFVWATLIIVGVEEAQVETSLRSMPLNLSFMPYSHGLVAAVIWSGVVYAIYRRVASDNKDTRAAGILVAAVFSHWILDLIVHRADLPLFADSWHVGLGLWEREVIAFVVEAGLLVVALLLYMRSTSGSHEARQYAMLALGGGLLLAQVAMVWGPFPEAIGSRGAAAAMLLFWLGLAGTAYLIEKRWSIGLAPTGYPESAEIGSMAARANEPSGRYEAIVIGTGFGGSISACRLAHEWPGQVLVLERGKRYGLGEFARSPRSGTRNLWNVNEEPHRHLDRVSKDDRGLFDVRSFKGLDAIVASGVGGGSLIYANVFLEAPDAVFDDPRWPASCGREVLNPYYAVTKEVLGSRPVVPPPNANGSLQRTELFARTAEKLGRTSKLADINVFFGNDPDNPLPPGVQERNRYGALQTSCVHCAECIVGCNVHAKNTMDLNYLFVAEHEHRAEIRTDALAQRIVPVNSAGLDDPAADGSYGYRVYFHDLEQGELASVVANRVVLSAGTFGSTELLLRSNRIYNTLPNLSTRLGENFSGNGDFLTYVMANQEAVDPNDGPTITQYTDFNLFDDYDDDRAFILEDAGYPSALAWFVEGARPNMLRYKAFGRLLRDTAKKFVRGRSRGRVGYAIRNLISSDYSYKTAVLLFMGRDKANGRLELDRHGRLASKWPRRENMALYNSIVKVSKDFKKQNKAKTYFPVPSWMLPFRRNVTVHPLGGCVLADDPASGVVSAERDRFGAVFGYENLYVADGAIVPAALGANPTATIAALSEMVAEGITGRRPTANLGMADAPVTLSVRRDRDALVGPGSEQAPVIVSPVREPALAVASGGPAMGSPGPELLIDVTDAAQTVDVASPELATVAVGAVPVRPEAMDQRVDVLAKRAVAVEAASATVVDTRETVHRAAEPIIVPDDGLGEIMPGGDATKILPDEDPLEQMPSPTRSQRPVGDHAVGFTFVETMRGFVDYGDHDDHRVAAKAGRSRRTRLSFTLEVTVPDVDFLPLDPLQQAQLHGTITASGLGQDLPVLRGDLNLFVPATDDPSDPARQMRYLLWFRDATNRPLTLIGHKHVSDSGVFHVWRDTTTLFTTVFDGHLEASQTDSAKVIGSGILRIPIVSFAKQLTTLRGLGGNVFSRCGAVTKFGRHFMRTLWSIYIAAPPQSPPGTIASSVATAVSPAVDPDRPAPKTTAMPPIDAVANAAVTSTTISTADGLDLTLTRFLRKPTDDVVVLLHGLTTSTDMYIMGEHVNLTSYLLDHGYTDVWGFDWRGSNRHGYNEDENDYDFDDIAEYDLPAAIDAIREIVGPDARIHLIAHCIGSLSTMLSLAGGHIDGISSVIANSVALTPRVPRWSRVKLAVAPTVMERVVHVNHLKPDWCRQPWRGNVVGKLLSTGVAAAHRECDDPVCNMVSFMWGSGRPAAFLHENMHDATHARLGELFGPVGLSYFRHVNLMVKKGRAVSMKRRGRDGRPRVDYLKRVGERPLPPVLFATGTANRIFADSNIVCHAEMSARDPDNENELVVFEGYGHQDVFMGKNCDREVFPRFIQFLDKHRGAVDDCN